MGLEDQIDAAELTTGSGIVAIQITIVGND